jgi:antitoxin ParD1/3/4/toxin ParE1/3/4
MRNYELTEVAQRDIDEILDFIAERKQNVEGAQVVLNYLHQAMQDMADDPNRGHYRRDLTDRPVRFYRKSKAHKYYLVFDPDTRPVRILRVASVRRDFVDLLEKSP